MDMAAIRARLQGLANKTGKRNDLWKPKDKHVIRCLPYPHDGDPIIELGFHYEIGDTRSLLCPKHNFGKSCAVCDFAEKLRSWNDEHGTEKPEATRKADFEIFKSIQVKPRWYIPVIDRADENPIPKFYSFSKTVYKKILNLCLNEEMAEIAGVEGTEVIFSVTSAFDLNIDFQKANNEDGKGNSKTYPDTVVTQTMRATPLRKTKKATKELLDKVPNMSDVYPEVSSEEVEKIFMKFINSGGGEPDIVDSGTEYESKSAEAPVTGGQSIDEAFADLTD